MEKFLVTGGAGFIGANFVHYWLKARPQGQIIILDALTYAGNLSNLARITSDSRVHFVHGDICDADLLATLMTQFQIDCVVHFAAESHVDRSIAGPDEFIHTNIVGTHALLKAARSTWFQNGHMRSGVRFHHISTDEVYGSLQTGESSFTEASPYLPSSPYSASKAASDHLVRAYSRTYDLPVTITNCSNNYGPFQFPEKLIPLMLVCALDGRPMPLYGLGENVRDWLYVEDHCRAIEAVLSLGHEGETYNVGGCNEWRNIDIVHALCNLLERRFAEEPALSKRFSSCPAASGRPINELITYVTDRPGHDWRYAIDASRIRKELGFAPVERFETGIAKTVDWYLANESWWRAVMSGAYRSQSVTGAPAEVVPPTA